MLSLCRICGQRCKKNKASKSSPMHKNNHGDRLLKRYGVNVVNDVVNQHPQYVCKCCIADCNKTHPSAREVIVWNTHIDDGLECRACELYTKTATGGRPRKPQQVTVEKRMKRKRELKEEKELAERMEEACNVLLSSQSQEPPTKKIKLVASTIIKRILMTSETPTIELPTKGPKLTLMKLTAPKISSNKASPRTIARRTSEVKEVIREVSSPTPGADEDAEVHQLAALLKGKSTAQLKKLLKDHSILQIRIPTGDELLLKAQMGWSWSVLRKLKCWLRAYRVSMAYEGATRKKKEELLNGWCTLKAEMLPLFFKEGAEMVTHLTPVVWIENLEEHVMKTLDELERTNQLTNDFVPEGEIWLKIGADKGGVDGGSVKLWYQVVNVNKPNAVENTIVICIFEADETTTNMLIAFEPLFQQINELQDKMWRNKTIVTWLCGDLAIQRKFLGLQGTSATFPCCLCHVTLQTLKSATVHTARTVENIKQDYENVVQQGRTKLSMKENHSVCCEPFFNIPVDQVCPPSLHISLGLFEKFFANLEKELQNLGEIIAKDLARKGQESSASTSTATTQFFQYVDKVSDMEKQLEQLSSNAEDLRGQAFELESNLVTQSLMSKESETPRDAQLTEIQKLHDEAKRMDKQAEQLTMENHLPKATNPLIQKLDTSLKEFKVRRQAYRSQSFVGNQVNKCLKEQNYSKLLGDMVEAAREMSESEQVWDLAEAIRIKFMLLFDKFGKCHKLYSSMSVMDQQAITNLKEFIVDLVDFYKCRFARESFTPKFHILMNHVVNFCIKTGVALGVMSEQGGEQLHALFNRLRKSLVGVLKTRDEPPELALLRSCMEEHLIQVYPLNRKSNPEE